MYFALPLRHDGICPEMEHTQDEKSFGNTSPENPTLVMCQHKIINRKAFHWGEESQVKSYQAGILSPGRLLIATGHSDNSCQVWRVRPRKVRYPQSCSFPDAVVKSTKLRVRCGEEAFLPAL